MLHLRFLQRAGAGEYELSAEQLFSLEEQTLFTRALELSEKKGKTIHLAVAAATEKWDAILRAAQSLESTAVVLGASPNTPVAEEARLAGLAWERLPDPKPQLTLEFYFPSGQEHIFYLGPHAPHLTPKEIDLLHGIWLEAEQRGGAGGAPPSRRRPLRARGASARFERRQARSDRRWIEATPPGEAIIDDFLLSAGDYYHEYQGRSHRIWYRRTNARKRLRQARLRRHAGNQYARQTGRPERQDERQGNDRLV